VSILKQIQESTRTGEKKLAFLIDPDKVDESEVAALMKSFEGFPPDFIFVRRKLNN